MKTMNELREIIASDIESYRTLGRTLRNVKAQIETIYNEDVAAGRTPKESVVRMMKELGKDEVRDVIATLTICASWDGRISRTAKEWAYNSGNGYDEEAAESLWIRSSKIHYAHLSQLAEACGTIKPADLEAEIADEDLDEAVSETISQAAEDADEETVEKAARCIGEGNGYYKEEILRKFLAALREAREAVKSGSDLTLRVSDRNNKMGKIPSVSTLPFLTCPSTCRNTCGKICYAAKLANLRPAVLRSYAINTALATLRPDLYWQQVRTVLAVSRFFRFHVSGDIINRAYLDEMISAALSAPHCEILVFTKRYNLVNAWIDENGDLPANLHILFSGWEDLSPENPHGLPETQVYGRKEEPDPSWLLCGGECSSCACRGLGCWQAKRGDVIAFRKH